MAKTNWLRILTVALLLLVQFGIRTHNIQAQQAYVDEGYHVGRADVAWDFDTNLAALSHGKLLTYFWLGLFKSANTTSLVTGRFAIALFSLITGATLYRLGWWLGGYLSGVIALGVYGLLPLAVVFERMALADPFAGGLAALVVWRSLVLARRPSVGQGIVVGVLLALASLAKMTMVGLPLVVVGATLVYFRWDGSIRPWLYTYFVPLAVAAIMVIVLWTPVLISAYFASPGGDDTNILNPETFQRNDVYAPCGFTSYTDQIVPLLLELVSPALVVAAGIAVVNGLAFLRHRRGTLLAVIWFLALTLPVCITARVVTSRYLMPVAVPVALLIGLGFRRLWNVPRLRLFVRGGLIAALAAWALLFALPTTRTAATDPLDLDLTGNNQLELQSGLFLADDRLIEAVDLLENTPGTVYATREACNLMRFYADALDLVCLSKDPIPDTGERLLAGLQPGEVAYFVESWFYGPFLLGIDWLETEEIALQTPAQYADPAYEFRLWKIWVRDHGVE